MKQNMITTSDMTESFISATSMARSALTMEMNRAAGKAKSSTTLLNALASVPENAPFFPAMKPASITTSIGTIAYRIMCDISGS